MINADAMAFVAGLKQAEKEKKKAKEASQRADEVRMTVEVAKSKLANKSFDDNDVVLLVRNYTNSVIKHKNFTDLTDYLKVQALWGHKNAHKGAKEIIDEIQKRSPEGISQVPSPEDISQAYADTDGSGVTSTVQNVAHDIWCTSYPDNIKKAVNSFVNNAVDEGVNVEDVLEIPRNILYLLGVFYVRIFEKLPLYVTVPNELRTYILALLPPNYSMRPRVAQKVTVEEFNTIADYAVQQNRS